MPEHGGGGWEEGQTTAPIDPEEDRTSILGKEEGKTRKYFEDWAGPRSRRN